MNSNPIPMQDASYDIWSKKYCLRDKDGHAIDSSIDATFERVARALANVEKTAALRKKWYPLFLQAMHDGAYPAGRIMSNAGATDHKSAVSLINCTVSNTIEDSMDGIFKNLHEAALTLKAGCGIGYEFSALRPAGAYVSGAGATTNGPLAFMDVYDKMCFTVSSAGGRRGAQMCTYSVDHPDTEEFIVAKREAGRFRQFNLSLLITDEFMKAVKNDAVWEYKWLGKPTGKTVKAKDLWNTIMESNYNFAEPGFILIDQANRMNNLWFCEELRASNPCVTGDTLVLTTSGYLRIDSLVDKEVKVWNGFEWSLVTVKITGEDQEIIDLEFSDGAKLSCTPYHKFVLADGGRVEAKELSIGERLSDFEDPCGLSVKGPTVTAITATGRREEFVYCFNEPKNHTGVFNGVMTGNCGEQILPPYGACLLGSINLTKFVQNPFTDKAKFDFNKYREVIGVFSRMLDNVVEINGLPLKQQRDELVSKRRHGMGFLGLGSALTMLRMKYGSPEAIAFTEDASRTLALEGFRAGALLAKEKGEAPALQRMYQRSDLEKYTKLNTNYGLLPIKTRYSGRELFLQSHYFDVFRGCPDGREVLKLLKEHGSRFTHVSSIAPTGTISLSFGSNVSNGIEPSFSHSYSRNIIREGRNAKESVEVCSYEYLAYKHLINPDVRPTKRLPDQVDDGNYLPDYFSDTDSLTPKEHIDIQAAAQKWIDSSISKTINVPTDMPFEEFKGIYDYAYKVGLKGCTTFRFNSENFSGVLVKTADLKSTIYRFTLEDGQEIDLPGNAEVEYLGQTQTAANLFDAIKEGYFGKF